MERLGYIVKFAIVIACISAFTLFIEDFGSLEFFLTLASLALSLAVVLWGAIRIRKGKE